MDYIYSIFLINKSPHEIWSNNEILSQILYNLNIKEVAKISRVCKYFYNSDPAQAINKDADNLRYQQINWINNDTNKNLLHKIYSKKMRESLFNLIMWNPYQVQPRNEKVKLLISYIAIGVYIIYIHSYSNIDRIK